VAHIWELVSIVMTDIQVIADIKDGLANSIELQFLWIYLGSSIHFGVEIMEIMAAPPWDILAWCAGPSTKQSSWRL
jgi:hypothetical protein